MSLAMCASMLQADLIDARAALLSRFVKGEKVRKEARNMQEIGST